MKEFGALIRPGIWIELTSDTPIFCHPYRYGEGLDSKLDVGSIGG
jgi:hypothetical protein